VGMQGFFCGGLKMGEYFVLALAVISLVLGIITAIRNR